MRLRTKLVVAVVGLSTVGLAVLGATTYSLYSSAEFARRDDQLRAIAMPVGIRLQHDFAPRGGNDDQGRPLGPGDRPDSAITIGAYGALYSTDGTLLATVAPSDSSSRPMVPRVQSLVLGAVRTVASQHGGGDWRLLATTSRGGDDIVVVALPLDDVDAALTRLLTIEIVGSLAVLLLLAGGVWFVVRRGLRPLEVMAADANRIAEGASDVRVAPAGDGSEIGALGGALNVMLDEIDAAFAQRTRDEARLRAFVADAAHELRTPLTSIRGFAELFRLDERPAGMDLDVILGRIEGESLRMQALVDDLLTLARLDEPNARIRAEVDLAALVADAASDLRAVDPTRTVRVDSEPHAVVLGDDAQLRQVFANLAANVVRHTPSGSDVEWSVRSDDDYVVISVCDHGPGIAATERALVFDRFWQSDPSRHGAGTGLGLAIVAAIVRDHRGTIDVDARDDGASGARFTLRFPRPVSTDSPSNP